MVADVPTLAIEYVNLYDNTSVLYDEQLLLRRLLNPACNGYRDVYASGPNVRSAEGEGCPACEVSLTLSDRRPGTVYSRDLTLLNQDPAGRS
jgi:DNA-directed RNA polymerase subunit D